MLGRSIAGCGKTIDACQAAIYRSTLLPFLYETQTLKRCTGWQIYQHDSFTAGTKRRISHLTHGGAHKPIRGEKLANIAFPPDISESVGSTLTPAERAVFTRIGEDAAERQAQYAQSEEGATEILIRDENDNLSSNLSLDLLFKLEKATIVRSFASRARNFLEYKAHRQHSVEPMSTWPLPKDMKISMTRDSSVGLAAKGLHQRSTELEQHLVKPSNIKSTLESKSEQLFLALEKDQVVSVDPLIHQIQIVQNRLESATSDVEIWETLQNRVFSQAQYLSNSTYMEEPNSRASAKKGRKEKKKRKNVSRTNESSQDRAANGSHSVSSQESENFAIIQASYAYHCWTALRRLRELFPQSPYASAILSTIKSFGPKSYVLGASTELYNEALFMYWVHYRNPNACADLRAEMLDRGIPSNPLTLAVFRDAASRWLQIHKALKAMDEQSPETEGLRRTSNIVSVRSPIALPGDGELLGTFEAAWWELEGVRIGYKRWQALEMEARERHEEDKRHKEEARKEAELDETESEGL